MNRVSVLISLLLATLLGLASFNAAWAVEAVDVKADIKVLDLSAVVESYEGDGDRIQVSTAPGPDGIVRRIEVRARQQGVIPGWFVFALANNTDRQIDRYLVVPHFRMSGSGLLKPDLGAQRVFAISTSQGFAPERVPDTEADVFRVTLDPGNVVTFVGEQSHKSLPRLSLWEPEAYKDYVNSYTFFRGIVLGIAGLLALFLVILFVVKGAAMFPAAALLAWSVLAYLAIDFGFMGRLFDIPTTYEPIWRAVAEVVFSASILILLFTYLTLHRWHVRYLHASGIWLIFLFAVLGVALYDPSLGAGIARLSMVVTSVAGFGVILYLAFTGFDRAIMLIPTWILLLLWLLASGSAVAGLLDNDLVQPALSGGLVLLVLLFCFTIMQHAFSGGILAQGIVSDSERRALAIVGSGDMVWDWDVPRDRIHTSRDTERVLGLKRGALDGHARDWVEFLHTQDKDRFSSMLDAIIEQRRGRVNQDFRLRAEDGHYRWFKLRARPVVGTDGEVVRCVGTLLDITEQRTAEARLLHDAVHDNLTGLANRELLQDRLDAAMVRTIVEGAAKPAILLVDIDNFRNINDTFGLSIGDSILLTVARRLSRLLKPQDSIARFYGDQFAIILISEQQPERIAVFADSVRKALKIPIVFGDRELSLSVSIGIAIQDIQAHKTAADVINDSELALYHSKRMGGDRIEPFRPSLRQQGRGRSSLDKDLVAALDRNEIEVVFQPIVDLNSRMIKGFEALARWNHPQRGAVPPSDFIPAAERTGLIVPLGLHIMEQAARQLNQWQQKLKGTSTLFMSVNVSSQQLLRHDLIHDVKTILSRCDVNPGTLKLELTESLVMANPEYASQVLDKLRALGAGLSLDDFGTGYSSLSYLQHFPFDTLKIDRSFVGHEQGATPIILQSIVKLAQDLQLNLVAEGIESEDAVNQLTAMGCPMGQGYLFGKPLVPEEAHAMLTKQLEQSQRMQDEAQARRQLAEMEAAARKADEQRKIKEEQRRKEAAELERAQSHAREVAAQPLSTPEVKKPLAQRAEAAKQDPKQDTLEAQLAAGLALDLGDENVPSSDHASAKPDVMSVSNQGNGKFHAAVQTNDDETDGGDLLADLDMALENAIGAAAAEAIAETTPTKEGFVRDLTNAEAPVSRAPQNHGASNTPPQRLPAGGSAKQSVPKASLRDKVGTASGLFLNSFKNKKAPNKFLKKLSGITAQNPAQTRDPASAPPAHPPARAPQPTAPQPAVRHPSSLPQAQAPQAQTPQAQAPHSRPDPDLLQGARQPQGPLLGQRSVTSNTGSKIPAMPQVAAMKPPVYSASSSGSQGSVPPLQPSPQEPQREQRPEQTNMPKPEQISRPAPTAPEPIDSASRQGPDLPIVQPRPAQVPIGTDRPLRDGALVQPLPGRAYAAKRGENEEVDSNLPFSMPDMSDIDQDIAAAIKQAMMAGKKN